MTKFKVGDKVRITGKEGNSAVGAVVGSTAEILSDYDGEHYKVLYDSGDGVANTHGWIAPFNLEHVSSKPTKNQRITTLESEVAELKAKVEALEKAQSPTNTVTQNITVKSDADISKVASQLAKLIEGETVVPRKKMSLTPNELRKAIIAEAKAFYTDTLNEYQLSDGEVVVIGNDKERSISVTIRHLFSLKPLLSGKSKCAPDDVFNADIGKAIALGRALGLDVSRFEQAVKPTEVVVGMVVNISNSIGSKDGAKVYAFANGAAGSPGILVTQFYGNRSDGFTWVRTDDAKQITDDTEAVY